MAEAHHGAALQRWIELEALELAEREQDSWHAEARPRPAISKARKRPICGCYPYKPTPVWWTKIWPENGPVLVCDVCKWDIAFSKREKR